jgi:hypothetical protein
MILMTTGKIADKFDVPFRMVEYVIRSRRIAPVGRAGIARVFDDKAVEAIGAAIRDINGRKQQPSPISA